jgi:hypothetical protein
MFKLYPLPSSDGHLLYMPATCIWSIPQEEAGLIHVLPWFTAPRKSIRIQTCILLDRASELVPASHGDMSSHLAHFDTW